MADLADVARFLVVVVALPCALAATAHFIADRRERRKWRSAVRRIPFIRSEP